MKAILRVLVSGLGLGLGGALVRIHSVRQQQCQKQFKVLIQTIVQVVKFRGEEKIFSVKTFLPVNIEIFVEKTILVIIEIRISSDYLLRLVQMQIRNRIGEWSLRFDFCFPCWNQQSLQQTILSNSGHRNL